MDGLRYQIFKRGDKLEVTTMNDYEVTPEYRGIPVGSAFQDEDTARKCALILGSIQDAIAAHCFIELMEQLRK